MTLKELRYVVAVAQELHFGRAAQKCFVSQPALSLAVQKLEEELGVALFERRKNDVLITPAGERVVAQAQRALAEVDAIKEIAHGGKDPLDGVFRLGVIHTVGPYLLPDLVPALRARAPNMPLEIEENLTANLDAMLKRGALDAIVIALPFDSPGIVTRVLFDEPFHLLVPNDHALAKRKSVSTDDIADQRLLTLRAGNCFRDQVLAACPGVARTDGDAQPLQGSSLETIRNMVASGLGISVFPASAVTKKHTHRLSRSIPFVEPAPSRRLALAWRDGFPRMAAIDVIAQAIGAVVDSIDAEPPRSSGKRARRRS
ncbi:MAG TPA: hydrogen peroxide-inducible genes activator [Pseudomonadales bacterium]|nr:hydrogen peroxide-inducible genes activator [Pseudomonadales bacterium]